MLHNTTISFIFAGYNPAEMKTNTRRHIASLAFIAFLAILYLVIILVSKNRGGTANDIIAFEKHTAADTAAQKPATANMASTDLPGKTDESDPSDKSDLSDKNKKRSSKKKSGKAPKPVPKDNPDVFDSPVPGI